MSTRLPWAQVPAALRAAPEQPPGGAVTAVITQPGGYPVTRGADPAAVTAVVAALAGYLIHQSRRPDPPGIPTVRAFQAAQGKAALDWLRARTGWR
jgi:hypothetical protein